MNSVSFINGHIDGCDTCVICGRDIPKGRQVCVICGYTAEKKKADLVEVVRCKECKNAMSPNKHSCYCSNFEEFVFLNDFCSYGERKGKE